MLLPIPPLLPLRQPTRTNAARTTANTVATPLAAPSNAAGNASGKQRALRQDEAAKPPAGQVATKAPAAAPKHSAPLSQRLEQENTNQHHPVRRLIDARPVTLGTRIAGLGLSHTSDRPQTRGLPSAPAAARDKATEMETLKASAVALCKRVDKIMDSTLEQLPDVNHRPGRPAWREKTLQYWPMSMFAATRVGDLIDKDPAYRTSNPAETREVAVSPSDRHAGRRQLLERTAELKHRLDEVQQEYDSQVKLHPREADGSEHEAVRRARERLEGILHELQASVTIGEHLDYYNHALATDLVEKKVRFVQEQVHQLDQQLGQAGLGPTEELEALRQRRDCLRQEAELARVSLQGARLEVARIKGAISDLEARRAALRERPTTHEATEEQGDLQRQRTALDKLLEEAGQAANDRREQMKQAQTACDSSIGEYGAAQMRFDLTLGGRIAESARSIDERAATWQARARTAWDDEKEMGKASLRLQVDAAPGFDAAALAGADGKDLRAMLGKVAAKLKDDDPDAEREVPAPARLEILSRAVAQVCNGDARRAASVLEALSAHPSEYWVPPPVLHEGDGGKAAKAAPHAAAGAIADVAPDGAAPRQAAPYASPSDDLKQLFRCMASVPRGMEILNEAGTDAAHPQLRSASMTALHAYWMADAHQPATGDPDPWLSKAQKMACYEVRNVPKEPPLFDSDALEDDVKIAYRGVCRGFLSNGPDSDYAHVNATLNKVGKDWLEHARDSPAAWTKGAIRTVFDSDNSRATPFDRRTLKATVSQLERQGLASIKTHAHDSIAARARELSAKLSSGWLAEQAPDAPNVHRLQVAGRALCDYIAHHDDSRKALAQLDGKVSRSKFHRTDRLYKSRLTGKDLVQLRRMAGARNFMHHTLQAFPDEFNAIFDGAGATPQEALQRLGGILAKAAKSQEVSQYMDGLKLDELQQQTDIARRKRFGDKDDAVAFFRPVLEELRLRNQLVMTAGSEVGVGIPLAPWVPVAPATMSVNANVVSKKNEAQFQIKSPTYGVEFIISDIQTRSHDIKASAGLGLEAGRLKATAPNGAIKLEGSKATTSFTTLRILRGKDGQGVRKEKAARKEGLAVLETLLAKERDKGRGTLDDILLKHPDVIVGWGSKENVSLQGSVEVGAILRVKGNDNASAGGSLSLSAKIERTQERSDERSGYAHQNVHDRSDQRKQRIAAAGTINVLGSYKKPVKPDDKGEADRNGAANIGGAANPFEVSRDLLLRLEKNGATRFSIGDQTGGSTDRAFADAGALLAEIEDNQEEFYLRFLETVPGRKGEPKDTPENRKLAADTLHQFMTDLKSAKKNPSLQFNLKYEMQPRMSGRVDALLALEALASKAGNHEAAQEHRRTLNDLLQQRSTWAFKNCAIRSKGKENADVGWDWLVRVMARRSAETSVAVTAYPA